MKLPTSPLLLEIGCEEIPARFLFDAQRQLGERLNAGLREARLEVKNEPGMRTSTAQTFSTPRRLVAAVPALLDSQPDRTEEVVGPPVRIAFDQNGSPSRAAESFAAKNNATVPDLVRVTTAKGDYLAIRKTVPGRPACELLPRILLQVVTGISFPKSMYWTSKSGPRFVRPIRWIVAVVGHGKSAVVVPFGLAGVESSNLTYGHRLNGRKGTPVRGFAQYRSALSKRRVEIDREERRRSFRDKVKVLLESTSSKCLEDQGLEEWIVDSTEWPHALLGDFEQRFLKLPREILVTVMRDHQKYFAVQDSDSNLLPHFIAALNVDGDPDGLIRAGHERVLTARFSDAEFFWNADQQMSLRERLTTLERVTYQVKLGSYADKVRRMGLIGDDVCSKLRAQGKLTAEQVAYVHQAIRISKCDLTTQMVQEFTELQGIVGGLYAAAQGESPEAAEAVYDQYKPANVEDSTPRGVVGAVVSLVDKLDSIVACFAVGLEPTGSSDPFALRRQGNGLIKIIFDWRLELDLRSLISTAAVSLPAELRPDSLDPVYNFLGERLRHYLESVLHCEYDAVRAAMGSSAGWGEPLDVMDCATAIASLRGGEDFVAVSQAAKRIRNILTKSASEADLVSSELEAGRLSEGPEHELYEAYKAVSAEAARLRGERNYLAALQAIATLRPKVDVFFDKVLVMANDLDVRRNRLQLLVLLDDLFSAIACFAEIADSGRSKIGMGDG